MNSTVEFYFRPSTLRDRSTVLDKASQTDMPDRIQMERIAHMFAAMLDASETQDSITIHFVK